MVTKNVPRGVLIGLLVLVGMIVAVAGSAAAQEGLQGAQTRTQLSATPPSEPVRPLSGLENINVDVTYTYQEGGFAFVTTPIELEVTNSPSWITATLSPSTVYMPVDGQSGEVTRSSTLVVQTTANAPAFQQGNIQIEGVARQNGDLAPSQGSTTVPVQAGFYSVIDAQTPKPVVIAGPQEQIDFPIEVTNFGNGEQTIFLNTNQKSGGLDIVLPGAFTVSSQAGGDEDNTRTSTVSIQTPFQNGYINQPGTFTLDVSSAYALDQSNEGMSTRISSLVTTKGFFVPGPGAVAALVSFAGVALALNRRRGPR